MQRGRVVVLGEFCNLLHKILGRYRVKQHVTRLDGPKGIGDLVAEVLPLEAFGLVEIYVQVDAL
jgi:hypothetical protein